MESTPKQPGLDVDQVSSPLVSPVSPHSAASKMSASPRPRMPAGPRVRKNTAGATNLTAQRSSTPQNITDFPPLPGNGRSSPGPSISDSGHSTSLPPRDSPPLPANEKAVQTESNDPVPSTSNVPTSTPVPSQAPATPESTRPSTPASITNHRVVNKPNTLIFPTPVNFNVDPISFKGLPLEAAQWSFTSDQLREMVSRAIRDSAKEQFIRLLSIDALDKEIPEELTRLESLKFTTQAQHRFHFQRRTNLLQSLNALAYSSPVSAENGVNTLGMLIQQLAEVTASMDRFTETLLATSEHRSQLAQVQEKHLSSALAVALRKLNASYAKRTTDLKNARARIAALQTELDQAWKVAEGMAEEMDDLENFKSDYAMEDSFEDGENDVQDEDPTIISVAGAQVVPVTGTAVVSKATLVGSPPPNGDQKYLTPPNTHVRRPRPSNASTSDRDRLTKVSAARKRISLISQSAIKVQRSNSESDGGSGLSAPNTPKTRRGRSESQTKDQSLASASPSLLGSSLNNSFLELSRPATPQPSDEEAIPPVPTLVRVQRADGGASTGTSTSIKLDMKQIHTPEDHQANFDYSPAFSAAFDSSMIPPPPPDSDLPSPLTRASSVNLPHPPSMQGTRRIQSMQPSLSVSSSLRDRDSEKCDRSEYDDDLQDSPVVPAMKVTQAEEEVHVVPLPDAEEDDKKLSTSHHAYDKSDLWPWTKRNTAILTDATPESLSSSLDDKVDPDVVVDIGPSSSTSMNVTVEIPDHDHASSSSYLPDMNTPSSSPTNGDGTEHTDSPVSIIASEYSQDQQEIQVGHEEPGSGTGHRGLEPPSPAPSDVPEMPVFPQARNSTLSLERHGTIGSFVARKNSLFRSHSSNHSQEKRSSMPLPSAVIASLLPWRGSKRPSSEPELPSQSSRAKSRLSSSLPSPH
ncbi:hypothetical protein BJ322DRAFT_1113624 [Thelephora terrestris]|uniref:Uncharacterized protein n=1 Tax=Thelephora terrestris TaxID=56493 RepID=A0A9P6H589_9AGAM|nr:hypothetical protein BJ322DRAFT_1113624 [Thelephora terrestris]